MQHAHLSELPDESSSPRTSESHLSIAMPLTWKLLWPSASVLKTKSLLVLPTKTAANLRMVSEAHLRDPAKRVEIPNHGRHVLPFVEIHGHEQILQASGIPVKKSASSQPEAGRGLASRLRWDPEIAASCDVVADVLHLLEGHLRPVDPSNNAWLDRVDQLAQHDSCASAAGTHLRVPSTAAGNQPYMSHLWIERRGRS
eukprot:924684-Pleurochrysis_carterae.AAC.2